MSGTLIATPHPRPWRHRLTASAQPMIPGVLLFGQSSRRHSYALLALASGYLFDALIIIPHALTFPGVFSDTGLLGAGNQTTAWLYVFWHGGFPLFILGYAIIAEREAS